MDPYGIDGAIARFAELLRETCPDLVVHPGMADGRGSGLPPLDRSVPVRVAQVNRILGTSLTADALPPLLDPIGYTVTSAPAIGSAAAARPAPGGGCVAAE